METYGTQCEGVDGPFDADGVDFYRCTAPAQEVTWPYCQQHAVQVFGVCGHCSRPATIHKINMVPLCDKHYGQRLANEQRRRNRRGY